MFSERGGREKGDKHMFGMCAERMKVVGGRRGRSLLVARRHLLGRLAVGDRKSVLLVGGCHEGLPLRGVRGEGGLENAFSYSAMV